MAGRWSRWVPAVVAPVLVAGGALAVATQAGAAVDLPDKSPADVLALLASSTEDSFSGTVEQTSDLGLPAIPEGMSGSDDAALAFELLTGSHTVRVYVDGPERSRVQVLDTLGERDVVRNGDDVWLWDSDENAATHLVLPADAEGRSTPAPEELTPPELADALVAAVEPSSELSVGQDAEVAGRAAYELVLTPRTSETLVASASIAVDAETGLPLAVTVRARGQDAPAFRAAWTAIDLGTPDAARFDFTPPAGASVEEQVLPAHGGAVEGTAPPERPTVVGTGWDAVVVLPAEASAADLPTSPLLAQVTREVEGGRVLSTALLTALVTDDGRVLVGAVPATRLQAVAAGL